jgi:hypothetical protein
METIRNFYTVSPTDLKSGDVLVCKLAVHLTEWQGQMYYAIYRCESDEPEGSHDIPQGSRIFVDNIKQIFPVLGESLPE